MNDKDDPKEAAKRSPNFPGIPLEEALRNIRTIYEKDKLNATAALVLLGHLGYEKLHGRSRRVLAALRQYGLLDELSNKRFKVAQDAFKLLNMDLESEGAISLLRTFALNPPMFGKVIADYKGDLPSDALLTNDLVLEKGFTPDGASLFIKVLRENISFAKITPEFISGGGPSKSEQSDGAHKREENPILNLDSMFKNMFVTPKKPVEEVTPLPAPTGEVKPLFRYSVPLSIQRKVNADLLISGTSLTKRDMEIFSKKVKDLLDAFEEDVTGDEEGN